MVALPKDSVFEIFSITPIKDLTRCRCVCKEWCEHISDPYLEKTRVKDEPTPIILQQFLTSKPDTHWKLAFLRIMEHSTTSMNVTEDLIFEFFQNDSSDFRTLDDMILGSCHGLILVNLSNDRLNHEIGLAVIDPINKKVYELPTIKNWLLCSAGIGFDGSTNSFKVICVGFDVVSEKQRTMVHVLGSGSGSWKEISKVESYPITGEGIYAHGYLYWLDNCFDFNRTPPITEGRKVVRFDLKREEFVLIDPPKLHEDGWINDQLVDLNDEVGYVYNNVENCSIEVWILKKNEWVMHVRLDQALGWPVRVSGCWNNEGDILLTFENGKRMYVYSLKSGYRKDVYREDECQANIRMYRKSLLSIHGINSNSHLIK